MSASHKFSRRLPVGLVSLLASSLLSCSNSRSSGPSSQTSGASSVDESVVPTGDGGGANGPTDGADGSDGMGGTVAEFLEIGKCTEETPVNPDHDSGQFSCKEQFVHRAFAASCYPEVNVGAGGEGGAPSIPPRHPSDQCFSDDDCDEGYRCSVHYNGGLGTWNMCKPFCREDADCSGGGVCDCSTAQCVAATCASDADCGDGLCINSRYLLGVAYESTGFNCQTPSDECHVQSDCPSLDPLYDTRVAYCAASSNGGFTCETGPSYQF